jgi:hypothetical protein
MQTLNITNEIQSLIDQGAIFYCTQALLQALVAEDNLMEETK